jgi:hypothetical protein
MKVIEKKGTLSIVTEPIGSVESGVMSLSTFIPSRFRPFTSGCQDRIFEIRENACEGGGGKKAADSDQRFVSARSEPGWPKSSIAIIFHDFAVRVCDIKPVACTTK